MSGLLKKEDIRGCLGCLTFKMTNEQKDNIRIVECFRMDYLNENK